MTEAMSIDDIEARVRASACPFCGGHPELLTSVRVQGDASLTCCVAMYEDQSNAEASTEAVILRWNTREKV